MNKIILIIKREYLTRVRKRTFIISTILFPLIYLGIVFGTSFIAAKTKSKINVAVIDNSGYFDKGKIERANQKDSSNLLTLVKDSPDSLKAHLKEKGFDGLIVVDESSNWENGLQLKLQTEKSMGMEGTGPLERKLNGIWDQVKDEKLGISDSVKNRIAQSSIDLEAQNLSQEASNSGVASAVGYTSGLLIYFILILYGSQVMMGVMEEKNNRIAEVIISSVKPFQLMLGKIIGIGLVALTQFALWILFVFIIYNATGSAGANSPMGGMVGGLQSVFTSIDVPLIIFSFAFYLLGGFFFYSSFYAAIGSAVNEDMREAQSLSFPVTMIVIVSIVLMPAVMKDPSSPLAVWGSIIPFSSPILMMARIPFGVPGTVPWWQLGLSMISLIGGFLFTTWFAGKIYRTGILMYGKKPSWKEMLKWAFRKS
ncbi:ABC transporter permease [Terrimonas sp. NA20]|uniref:ABC transporter permease n=1 Tax=Terrimonas ginsenosidimutans TaxID=2908004 RepID=A0ABS9L0P6_9BACT|nr:ABC transporter permease [Terrimonas ginsenosidimutans]MCG2618153.1 ABC transporter permease [Terrimonas ginsenosidimutans]